MLLAVLALLAACGSDEPSALETEREPAAAPRDPPPKLSTGDGPPPAWLETGRGSFWLGHSTFCWGGTCADYVAPSCDSERVPTIAVRPGEHVTAHLGFEPREVSLTLFPGASSEGRLPGGRDPRWRVEREGPFSLFAVAKEGGDASYVACLELD